MPRIRGRLYSSWASSTCSLPSALDGVLREDVEDQLGAVDDPQLELVLEPALLAGIEVVVDDQRLGAAARNGLFELGELSLPHVGARIRGRRRCTSSPTGSTPAVRRSSRISASSSSSSTP